MSSLKVRNLAGSQAFISIMFVREKCQRSSSDRERKPTFIPFNNRDDVITMATNDQGRKPIRIADFSRRLFFSRYGNNFKETFKDSFVQIILQGQS